MELDWQYDAMQGHPCGSNCSFATMQVGCLCSSRHLVRTCCQLACILDEMIYIVCHATGLLRRLSCAFAWMSWKPWRTHLLSWRGGPPLPCPPCLQSIRTGAVAHRPLRTCHAPGVLQPLMCPLLRFTQPGCASYAYWQPGMASQ